MASHSLDVLSQLVRRVPDDMVERARAWRPGTPSAPAAPAASVILLRDSPGGLETFLLHRHARMSFAASMVVFPGGKVDPVDHRQPDPILGCAIRETEEETGVRLAPDELQPWAYWVTPQIEPRRYDTHFFVAELPRGQAAADVSGETDFAEWCTPTAAVEAQRAGQIAMMPPTLSILLELLDLGSVASVRQAAADRVIERVLPELIETSDGWQFRYPHAPRS
ncbi:MAG TPA: NUDIX domain-containing protein [Propionibacteriaceae bacterium]|nr:NUDIX domain-containing protein [Propionibacteriaceae bacterium]